MSVSFHLLFLQPPPAPLTQQMNRPTIPKGKRRMPHRKNTYHTKNSNRKYKILMEEEDEDEEPPQRQQSKELHHRNQTIAFHVNNPKPPPPKESPQPNVNVSIQSERCSAKCSL